MASVKAISILTPWAYAIAYGAADVESRKWSTSYRGRLLLHASGNNLLWPPLEFFDDLEKYLSTHNLPSEESGIRRGLIRFQQAAERHYNWTAPEGIEPEALMEKARGLSKEFGPPFMAGCIIGEVDLVDVVTNHTSPWASPDCYHWVLANPTVYDKPIPGVSGKPMLWVFQP